MGVVEKISPIKLGTELMPYPVHKQINVVITMFKDEAKGLPVPASRSTKLQVRWSGHVDLAF